MVPRSHLGVKFKISDEHPRLLCMGVPPPQDVYSRVLPLPNPPE